MRLSEICSMLESFSVIRSMLPTILPFSSSLPLSPSFPFLHYLYLALPHFHPLNSSSLLPSSFFPLPLPPFSPGSSTFLPSIGYLSTYKEPTGQPGLEKVHVWINSLWEETPSIMFSFLSPPGSSGHWYSGGQYHQHVLWPHDIKGTRIMKRQEI